jgi:hypothetical protein
MTAMASGLRTPYCLIAALCSMALSTLCPIAPLAAPPAPDPSYKVRGWWEPPYDWGTPGTHIALLRGTDTHSQIIWWYDSPSVRVWKWNPGDGLSPASVLLNRPTSQSNLHCAGQSMLPDGRLLVTGGSQSPGGIGIDHVNVFDPVTVQWKQRPPEMTYHRWYPTQTTLADGRVLLTGGRMFRQFIAIGGGSPSGPKSDLVGLGLRGTSFSLWMPETAPAPLPPERRSHTAVFDASNTATAPAGFRYLQRILVFGGMDAGGAPLQDLWSLTRDDLLEWQWTEFLPEPDPVWGVPAARSDHVAVMCSHDSSMVVFGGLGDDSLTLGDVWRLQIYQGGAHGRWRRLLPTGGDATLERHGHAAVYDPLGQRLLLFGGRSNAGLHNDVWQLSLTGPPAWTKLTPTGVLPEAREDHAAIFDPVRNRLVSFGGRTTGGLLNDVGLLTFSSPTTADWSTLAPGPDPSAGTPAPRYRHVVVHDTELDRLLVFGGDSNLDESSGHLSDFWHLSFRSPMVWGRHHVSLPSGGRESSAGVYDTRYLDAITPEIYDPLYNTYTVLNDAPKWLALYPSMFLLPSGKLLYAGASFFTLLLNLETGTWETPPWSASGFPGFTSVMYLPGKVLKCGGSGSTGSSVTKRIDLTGDELTASWQPVAPSPALISRVDHNLVMLPTGEVLAAGGIENSVDITTAVRTPQIWNPVTDMWSDPARLAADPSARDYHSSAILLPDGRILSAGGDRKLSPEDRNRNTATIYWPPYLFDENGALAPRPQINSIDPQFIYGSIIPVSTPDATSIQSVCLIRPGSTTHGVDEEQRFVPLSFSVNSGGDGLDVTVPPDGNLAPPGYYLFFAVNADSVPSVAQWVKVSGPISAVPPEFGVRPAVAAFPNPFQSATTLTFFLTEPGEVRLTLFDAAGRQVRKLHQGHSEAGPRQISWDGRNDEGQKVASGVYMIRLQSAMGVGVSRVVRLGN